MAGTVTGWIHLLQAGDVSGARPLFNVYFPRLARLGSKLLRAAGGAVLIDGDDVAQQTLASLICGLMRQRFSQLANREELEALLTVIARRRVANVQRDEHRLKRRGSGAEHAPVGPQPVATLSGSEPTPEMLAIVESMLQRLEAETDGRVLRVIVEMRLAGYEINEIAQRLEISEATVFRRLRLVRDLVRSEW